MPPLFAVLVKNPGCPYSVSDMSECGLAPMIRVGLAVTKLASVAVAVAVAVLVEVRVAGLVAVLLRVAVGVPGRADAVRVAVGVSVVAGCAVAVWA